MTRSGGAVLLITFCGLGISLRMGKPEAALISLTMLIWLFQSWVRFLLLQYRHLPLLQLSRTVNGKATRRAILQAGRLIEVQIRLTLPRETTLSFLQLTDLCPENFRLTSGGNSLDISGSLQSGVIHYQGSFRGSGTTVLPGFRIRLEDDCGFFRADWFVACHQEFLVLPAWTHAGDVCSQTKRLNVLPRHGIHSHRRGGVGAELLELREYMPGDSPRSIAWKVSARRDQLMSRQYEAEVPIRVQLILDGTISMRMGGFGERLLDQSLFVAASVARSAIAAGDEVGAVCCDERGINHTLPKTGERGFRDLLRALAQFSDNPAPPPEVLSDDQQTLALSMIDQRYPHLLKPRANSIPWTVFPLLPMNRERYRSRFLLAGALASLFDLSLREHIFLVQDDTRLARLTHRFFTQERQAWLAPVVTLRNRGIHSGMARVQLISAALNRLTARARDNEVFVILADLLEVTNGFSQLLPAVRMARSRHHKVIAVCPTPRFQRPDADSRIPRTTSAEDLLLAAEQIQISELKYDLQKELQSAGVITSLSGEPQAIRLIATEMELTRSGRTRAAGGSR